MDLEYIKEEKVSWEEIERMETGMYDMGVKDGRREGVEEGIEIGEKKGAQQRSIDMAREMKKDGEAVTKISKYTGLSTQEIEQL